MLTELGDRLEGAAVGVTVGTNLFLGTLPDTPVDCGSLLDYEGAGMVRRHGETSATLCEMQRVQLLWRSASYATGLAMVRAVWKALECTNTTLGTTWYQRVEADAPPAKVGRDDNERHLFTCNLTVTREAK